MIFIPLNPTKAFFFHHSRQRKRIAKEEGQCSEGISVKITQIKIYKLSPIIVCFSPEASTFPLKRRRHEELNLKKVVGDPIFEAVNF